jgi:hypothetical protein
MSKDTSDDSNEDPCHDSKEEGYDSNKDDRKVAARKPPNPKKMKTTSQDFFHACTMHQVSGYMLNSLPASQQAALCVLDNLSSSLNNVSKTIVQSTVKRGNIKAGMLQEVAITLLHAEKLRNSKK